MLKERKDLIRIPHLEAETERLRDVWEKTHPRWVKIKGKRTPVFRGSEAGACQRRLCYAYRGDVPAPNDVEGMRRLHDGNPHGAANIHWLKVMGYKVTDEEKEFKTLVKTKAGVIAVRGHVDGIIHAPSGEEGKGEIPYILENKGLSTYTMKKAIDEIVNEGYRYQAQMYMWLSDIPRTLFAIKDKNSSEIRMYEYLYNERVIKKVIAKWTRVVAAVKAGELLDREYDQDSLQCKWCGHNKECWG